MGTSRSLKKGRFVVLIARAAAFRKGILLCGALPEKKCNGACALLRRRCKSTCYSMGEKMNTIDRPPPPLPYPRENFRCSPPAQSSPCRSDSTVVIRTGVRVVGEGRSDARVLFKTIYFRTGIMCQRTRDFLFFTFFSIFFSSTLGILMTAVVVRLVRATLKTFSRGFIPDPERLRRYACVPRGFVAR